MRINLREQPEGLELQLPYQCDVLGVKCVGPPEQDGGLPRDVLEDAVPEQPDPQPARTYSSCCSASFLVI
jgi:hypothetical protein